MEFTFWSLQALGGLLLLFGCYLGFAIEFHLPPSIPSEISPRLVMAAILVGATLFLFGIRGIVFNDPDIFKK